MLTVSQTVSESVTLITSIASCDAKNTLYPIWFAFTKNHNLQINDCIIINSPLPKTKCPRIPFRPGFLTAARGSGKDYKDFLPLARITRTKVVLARKYKEQGSGSTPALS